MGILSRFKDIMSANINALLDKAEDPEKMIDQTMRNLNKDLAKVREETAAVMADENKAKRQIDEATAEVNKMQSNAEKAVLAGNMRILCEMFPDAEVTGFSKPSEALDFVRFNHVDIAFLDIAMGKTSGIDLCKQMTEIKPELNVVFLTAFPEFSLESWDTQACGFLVKPLIPEDIRKQLSRLRYPVSGLIMKGQK